VVLAYPHVNPTHPTNILAKPQSTTHPINMKVAFFVSTLFVAAAAWSAPKSNRVVSLKKLKLEMSLMNFDKGFRYGAGDVCKLHEFPAS